MIATGSSPAIPAIDGLDTVDYWTNVEATETLEVPARLVVLGGGPVGCELAQFFQRVGSQVTLVQSDDRLLSRVDADAAALVEDALQEDGVDVRLNAQAESVRVGTVTEDGSEVRVRPAAGRNGPQAECRRARGARPDDRDAGSWSTSACAPPRTSGRSAT